MKKIKYVSPRIGPKARRLIGRDRRVMFSAHTRTREIPLCVDRARGALIRDVDGNEFLDFGAGYAVVGTGHCHPKVVKAAAAQLQRLIHISGSDFYYEPQVKLAEKLIKITPGQFDKRVYFGNSGAEAVEAALKIARFYTRRPRLISFLGAFHGRSFAGMTMCGSRRTQRAHFSSLLPEVHHVPYPYCFHCLFNETYPRCVRKEFKGVPIPYCLSYLTETVFERLIDPEDVSLILVEPIQGEGGYIVPPREFLPALRRICDEYGIVLAFDEIQSGLGRTGRWFACDHFGVAPDLMLIAKAIASGLPLSAVVGHARFMDCAVDKRAWTPGSHGSTFGGNPVACAAGLASLDEIGRGLIANAARTGDFLKRGLTEIMQRHRIIGEVRGLGLMIGMELVQDRRTREPFPRAVSTGGKNIKEIFTGECYKRGLIMFGAGFQSIRMSPPLSITLDQAGQALRAVEDVVGWIEERL